LELTSVQREAMGGRARELFRRRFTVSAMADSLLSVVREYDRRPAVPDHP